MEEQPSLDVQTRSGKTGPNLWQRWMERGGAGGGKSEKVKLKHPERAKLQSDENSEIRQKRRARDFLGSLTSQQWEELEDLGASEPVLVDGTPVDQMNIDQRSALFARQFDLLEEAVKKDRHVGDRLGSGMVEATFKVINRVLVEGGRLKTDDSSGFWEGLMAREGKRGLGGTGGLWWQELRLERYGDGDGQLGLTVAACVDQIVGQYKENQKKLGEELGGERGNWAGDMNLNRRARHVAGLANDLGLRVDMGEHAFVHRTGKIEDEVIRFWRRDGTHTDMTIRDFEKAQKEGRFEERLGHDINSGNKSVIVEGKDEKNPPLVSVLVEDETGDGVRRESRGWTKWAGGGQELASVVVRRKPHGKSRELGVYAVNVVWSHAAADGELGVQVARQVGKDLEVSNFGGEEVEAEKWERKDGVGIRTQVLAAEENGKTSNGNGKEKVRRRMEEVLGIGMTVVEVNAGEGLMEGVMTGRSELKRQMGGEFNAEEVRARVLQWINNQQDKKGKLGGWLDWERKKVAEVVVEMLRPEAMSNWAMVVADGVVRDTATVSCVLPEKGQPEGRLQVATAGNAHMDEFAALKRAFDRACERGECVDYEEFRRRWVKALYKEGGDEEKIKEAVLESNGVFTRDTHAARGLAGVIPAISAMSGNLADLLQAAGNRLDPRKTKLVAEGRSQVSWLGKTDIKGAFVTALSERYDSAVGVSGDVVTVKSRPTPDEFVQAVGEVLGNPENQTTYESFAERFLQFAGNDTGYFLYAWVGASVEERRIYAQTGKKDVLIGKLVEFMEKNPQAGGFVEGRRVLVRDLLRERVIQIHQEKAVETVKLASFVSCVAVMDTLKPEQRDMLASVWTKKNDM